MITAADCPRWPLDDVPTVIDKQEEQTSMIEVPSATDG